MRWPCLVNSEAERELTPAPAGETGSVPGPAERRKRLSELRDLVQPCPWEQSREEKLYLGLQGPPGFTRCHGAHDNQF